MNTQPRRQTEWFDELAYRIRPRAESPAQPSSSGSTEPESDSAARPATLTWYNALEEDNGVSTSLRMRSSPGVPPSTSRGRRVGSRRRDGQWQNSPQYRPPSNDRDIDRFSDNESGPQDFNIREIQEDRSPRRRDRSLSSQESSQRDVDDPMSVLVQRIDSIEQSCRGAVREGMDKINDSIVRFQNTVSSRVPKNSSVPLVSQRANSVKLTGFPVRRSNETRDRQKNIRKYLARLLTQSPSPIVEAADAQAFYERETSDECCTVGNFQIDLSGPLKSKWNRSASQVFAYAYCDFYKIPAQTQRQVLTDVAERFLNRIKALKAKHHTQTLSNSEKLRLLQVRRRRTRKTTLFHRRLEAAERHPQLQQHSEILQRLGIDGMSSDESDYEEISTNPPAAMRPPRYYVMRPRWRDNILSDWLETFDVVYNILRRESLGRRGAYARRRVQNSTTAMYSQSPLFVPRLPINAYEESWLSRRRDTPFSVIPTDAYNFTHSPEVISYMRGTVLNLPQDS